MRIYIFLLFIVAFWSNGFSQKKVVKAQIELKQHNYGRAYTMLHQAKLKQPTEASFVLTSYFLSNFAWNADSAFYYYQQTKSHFDLKDQKQKSVLQAQISLSDSSLQVLFNELAFKAFDQAKKTNTLEKFELVRSRYNKVLPVFKQATILRDSLAYAKALAANQSGEFLNFIALYPEALQVSDAQIRFEECFYLEQTFSNSEAALAQFIQNNSNSRFVSQAWQRLYVNVQSDGSLEAFAHFARTYPNSPYIEDAWRRVYQLFMKEYSVERLESFKQSYPDYPDIKTLESDGALLLTVLYPWLENGKYGFIDQDGKLRIACTYDEASGFYDGAAIVTVQQKMGLINKKNEIIAPLVYDEIFDAQQRTFIVKKADYYGVINHLGNFLHAPKYKDIQRLENGALLLEDSSGFYLSWTDGVLFNNDPLVYEEVAQYLDSQKEEVVVNSSQQPAANLPVVFIKNGKKGLKLNGKEILAATFEEILPYQSVVAIAKKKGKYGLLDALGKTILNFDYNAIRYISGIGYLVELNNLLGIYIIDQGFTIPISYEAIKPFEKNYLLVAKDGKDGLLTLTGKPVLETQYQRIVRFDAETLLLEQAGKLSYYLEKEARLIERLQ